MIEGADPAIETRVAMGEIHRLIEKEVNAIALLDVVLAVLAGDLRVDAIEAFRHDHERHARSLVQALRAFDGPPFEPSGPTALGRFESATCAREAGGSERILLTLVVHEHLALAAYERRLESEFPAEARRVLEEAADDERRHLEWSREALDDVLARKAAAPKA